jgi:4-hydroxy-4-methyl-2-oxoglutarate aldolase
MSRQSSQASQDVDCQAAKHDMSLAGLRKILSVALLCDALDTAGLKHQSPRLKIRPITVPDAFLMGHCKTLLWAEMAHADPKPYELELAAVDSCRQDDVLVCAAAGSRRSGIWGELLSTAARNAGCVGAIIDGAVRDVAKMRGMGFPIFARGTSPYDSRDRQRVIDYDIRIELDGIEINPGDLIAADEDGIVVIPKSVEAKVMVAASEKALKENGVRDAIRGGMSATEAFKTFGVL